MNTEQAFVEGFVKRASEYGFNESEATELLKKAARGQRTYALMNNVSNADAAQRLRSGISSAPGRTLRAPERGSMSADVLANLAKQVKQSIKTPPQNPAELDKRYMMQNTGRWMMNPSTDAFNGDRSKAMNAGIDLLGESSPWKKVNPEFANSPAVIYPHAR